MAQEITITQSGSVTLEGVAYTTTVTRTVPVSRAWRSNVSIATGTARNVAPINRGGQGFEKIKFMSITNTDATNFLNLVIKDNGSTAGYTHIKLLPEKTFTLASDQIYNDQTLPASIQDMASITLQADTAAVVAKVFIAI